MSLRDFFSWLKSAVKRTPDAAPTAPVAPAVPAEKPTCILIPLIDELQAFVGGGHPILMATLEFIEEQVHTFGQPICDALERAALTYLTIKHPIIAPVLLPLLRAQPASAGQNGAGGPDTAPPAEDSRQVDGI